MSQNITDDTQTTTEQPTGAVLLGKMSDATAALIAAQEKLVKAAADVARHTTDPSAHGAATLENITKAMPTPVLENGMFTFKDADGNDIISPVNLKGDTGEKGDDGAKGDKGDMPDHRWNGTALQMQKPDGTWGEEQDLRGPKGEDGINGQDGAPGQAPEHEWNGPSLKFKNPDGTWGEEHDLQGPKGEDGADGAPGPAPDHRWNGTALQVQKPDGSWGDEQDLKGEKGEPGDATVATDEQPGIVQPDGMTTKVDEDGKLSALGGNLRLNDETIITESGEWEAPVTGWYFAFLVAGGDGGMTLQSSSNNYNAYGGAGGRRVLKLMYLEEGDVLQAIIGAGGIGYNRTLDSTGAEKGGATSFGDYSTDDDGAWGYPTIVSTNTLPSTRATGNGPGGGESWTAGKYYGAGGGAGWLTNASAYNGAQGAVFLYYHDPALAAGPVPVPALFAARRMARAADAPATVRLYDPATGRGSVWREEDAEARLAEGLITEAAWLELCAQKAAEDRDEWLASPDTVAERFAMLRAERDAKLAATDYLVAPDYPLTDGQRAAVTAYRQALRDLPAQAGAPWDGGGELTPWPEAPTVAKAQGTSEESEQTGESEV